MPSAKNWSYFFFLNLLFVAYIGGTFYLSSIQDIKNNWPQYRCNPMYMPLSDNIEQDFTYCIQSMQSNYMGYLLQPLTSITNSNTNILSNAVTEINSVRAMFDKVRTFISSAVQSVFGVFLNLVIEFQKITIGMKDLIGKTIGIMVALMYMIDGSIKTMNSTWNGPPGQMVKALGKCFHPLTKVSTKNGIIKCMKDIDLGEVLEDGSIVESVMKISNERNNIPFYKIPLNTLNKNEDDNNDMFYKDDNTSDKDDNISDKDDNISDKDDIFDKDEINDFIFVTGSHLVFDAITKRFVKVENYKKAIKTEIVSDWFSCLITNTHKIPIGREIFWDWEDHFIKRSFY